MCFFLLFLFASPRPPSLPPNSPFSCAQLDLGCKFSCFLILLFTHGLLVVLSLADGFQLHRVKALSHSSSFLHTVSRQWRKIKANKGPSGIHSHSAIVFRGSMFVFGGERKSHLLHDLWRFNLDGQFWQKITTLQGGMLPNPRSRHTAVGNPFIHLASSTNGGMDLTSPEESSSMHSHLSPLAESDVSERTRRREQKSLQHSSSIADATAAVAAAAAVASSTSSASVVASGVTMNPANSSQAHCTAQETEATLNPGREERADEKENEQSDQRFPGIRMRRRRKNRLIASNDRPMSDFILESASPEKLAADAAAAAQVENDGFNKNRLMPGLGGTSLFPEESEWPMFGQNKRYTVHESMSYYALCFPSPQLSSSIQRKANQVTSHHERGKDNKYNGMSLLHQVGVSSPPKLTSFRPKDNLSHDLPCNASKIQCNNNDGSNNVTITPTVTATLTSNSNNNNSSRSSSSNGGSNESSTAVSPDATCINGLLPGPVDSRLPLMRNQTDLLLQSRPLDSDVDAACLELRIQSPPSLSHSLLTRNAEVVRRRRRSKPLAPPVMRRTIDTFDPSTLDFTCEFEEDDLLNCTSSVPAHLLSQSKSYNFDFMVDDGKPFNTKCTTAGVMICETSLNNTINNNVNNNNINNSINNNNNNNNNINNNNKSSASDDNNMINTSSSKMSNSKSNSLSHGNCNFNVNSSNQVVPQIHQVNGNCNQETSSIIMPIRRAWSAYSPSKFNLMNYMSTSSRSNNRLNSRCSGRGNGGGGDQARARGGGGGGDEDRASNLHQSNGAVSSTSTAGDKTSNSTDWKLCMYVFGGREDGATFAYKQPISVWKLYI